MDTMTITLAGMINTSRNDPEDAYYAANASKPPYFPDDFSAGRSRSRDGRRAQRLAGLTARFWRVPRL